MAALEIKRATPSNHEADENLRAGYWVPAQPKTYAEAVVSCPHCACRIEIVPAGITVNGFADVECGHIRCTFSARVELMGWADYKGTPNW